MKKNTQEWVFKKRYLKLNHKKRPCGIFLGCIFTYSFLKVPYLRNFFSWRILGYSKIMCHDYSHAFIYSLSALHTTLPSHCYYHRYHQHTKYFFFLSSQHSNKQKVLWFNRIFAQFQFHLTLYGMSLTSFHFLSLALLMLTINFKIFCCHVYVMWNPLRFVNGRTSVWVIFLWRIS